MSRSVHVEVNRRTVVWSVPCCGLRQTLVTCRCKFCSKSTSPLNIWTGFYTTQKLSRAPLRATYLLMLNCACVLWWPTGASPHNCNHLPCPPFFFLFFFFSVPLSENTWKGSSYLWNKTWAWLNAQLCLAAMLSMKYVDAVLWTLHKNRAIMRLYCPRNQEMHQLTGHFVACCHVRALI